MVIQFIEPYPLESSIGCFCRKLIIEYQLRIDEVKEF